MKKYKVTKGRQAENMTPLCLKEGDHVLIKSYSDPEGDWAGWAYCETKDNEGWIPLQIVRTKSDLGFIEEDYDATEFDLIPEEIIIGSYELNGWVWGHKEGRGEKGWAPLNHLKSI